MAKRRPAWKKLIGFVYMAVALVMLYSLGVSFQRVYEAKNELAQLEEKRDLLMSEKKELEEEVELLNDDDYVVRYAREHYIFSKDGEEVATLPESKK